MAQSLYKLVYCSHGAIGEEAASFTSVIEQILDASRRQNTEAGVTGALMFNEGCFAQVLEGELEAVEETFERIQMDERHDRVAILTFEKAQERVFSDWSMGWAGNDSHAAQQFATFVGEIDANTREVAGERIYLLLKQHMLSERRTGIEGGAPGV